jgi:hypothetical protein
MWCIVGQKSLKMKAITLMKKQVDVALSSAGCATLEALNAAEEAADSALDAAAAHGVFSVPPCWCGRPRIMLRVLFEMRTAPLIQRSQQQSRRRMSQVLLQVPRNAKVVNI